MWESAYRLPDLMEKEAENQEQFSGGIGESMAPLHVGRVLIRGRLSAVSSWQL